MNRRITLLVLLTWSGCHTGTVLDAPAPEAAAKSATTRLARVAPASSLGWLEAPARSLPTPGASAVVSAPLPARVVAIRVQPGEHVSRGAALIDVTIPELIRAAGTLSAADLRLSAFEARRRRIAPLTQEGLVRSADLTELDAQIATAKADRESARATLRAAGLGDQRALDLLSGSGTLALRAPIDGVVVSVTTKLGEMRDESSGALVEIAAAAPTLIEARFHVLPPEDAQLLWVEPGRTVTLVVLGTSPSATREDGTRVLWLRAKADEDSPIAHALGRVRVVPPAAWSVIPAGALVRRAEQTFVRVPDASGRRDKPVEVVRETSDECVVTGLTPGEEVFLTDEPAP
jgi:membrane fusion protein, heavy metal efflux system